MTMEGNNLNYVETRLAKGDTALPKASIDTDTISVLTGEARESNARAYAALKSKRVAKQYVGIISTLNNKLEDNEQKVTDL